MRGGLIIAASLLILLAPCAMAQQADIQQVAPQPTQTPKPSAPAKPKPKPAAAAPAKKPVPAAAPDVKARLLERIKDWTVFIYEGAEGRVCFAASAPTDMQPKTAKRTSVIFYVTTWQKDGIHNEVSVRQGYAMKANGAATVTVGGQNFSLAADDDKAYPKDPADERKLLAAMAAGGPMTVKATSAKGTQTTDQYSLDGVAAAVQKLEETCP
jgi:Invasion associated locus B (IalB) protein